MRASQLKLNARKSGARQLRAWISGLALLAAIGAQAAPIAAKPAPWRWVASWGTAQMVPEAQNELPAVHWRDGSLRQIVRTSLGGTVLRVRVSNAFGTAPMALEAASIARALTAGKPDVDAATIRPLTFGGQAAVIVPAGAEYYSDPVELPHAAGTDLAISYYFKGEPARQTGHPGSRTTSFLLAGRHEADAQWPEPGKVVRWYALADVEVQAPRATAAVVAIGDSITDGYGATTDGNDRWTDFLVTRLAREKMAMGVVNAGIGGGRMLRDGLGPNLAARFERDVLGRSGVTHALVQIGVNDLGGQHRAGEDTPAARAALVEGLKLAHRQLVERAHAQGICVIGATVTPYVGSGYYKPEPHNEEDRQALNRWIRTSGVFDAVADFDAALRDPRQPERLQKALDVGDGLHPSIAGYRAMAEAVPLDALRACGAAK
jgi:lysophospholipase L1-like esterase